MKKLLISMALVVMAASGAQAADPPMMVDPVLADDPAMDWTGPYIGPRISVNSRRTRVVITDPAGIVFVGPNGPFDNTYSRSTFGIGAQAGYLFQTGRFVLGVQGDIEWHGTDSPFVPLTSGDITGTQRAHLNGLGSVVGKAGIALNKVMLYVVGGLAAGSVTTQHVVLGNTTPNFTATQIGYTVGAGGEVALSENFSIFGEYRFTDLGTANGPVGVPFPPGSSASSRTLVHAGVFGFNWRP